MRYSFSRNKASLGAGHLIFPGRCSAALQPAFCVFGEFWNNKRGVFCVFAKILLAFYLLFLLPCSVMAQGSDVQLLRMCNAALLAENDSLRLRLIALETPDDNWDALSGIEDVVSYLDAGTDRASLVALASPSMDVPWKPSVDKAIERYTGPRRKMMCNALGRYARHYDYFQSVFSKYGVPEELTAICIVESAVSPGAVSPAGAVGMWQLMPSTARQYGLAVDENRDERTDVRRSTVAAAMLLRDLYRNLGSWTLSVMAYNCGSGAVRKAQILSGGSKDPWRILSYLPKETQGYLPSFLAVSYLTVYGEREEGLVANVR